MQLAVSDLEEVCNHSSQNGKTRWEKEDKIFLLMSFPDFGWYLKGNLQGWLYTFYLSLLVKTESPPLSPVSLTTSGSATVAESEFAATSTRGDG